MGHLPERYEVQPLERPFDGTGERSPHVPGSKSLTNRALLLAALGDGQTVLNGVLFSDDTERMLEALGTLGFELEIDRVKARVVVKGCSGRLPGHEGRTELFLGNAGTATRFMTAAMPLADGGEYVITGIERMKERPIGELVEPLREMGAEIEYLGNEGYPPVLVKGMGKLKGGVVKMRPTLSSQYISALLQVGLYCEEGLVMEFEGGITSLPYVKMTVELMRRFGGEVEVNGDWSRIEVRRGMYGVNGEVNIEPDASNASYAMGAAAISGSVVEIKHLNAESLQGDAAFARELGEMGAKVEYGENSIVVRGTGTLKGIDADFNAIPDMVQTIAVVALFAEGKTTIRDVGNLRVKETDRLAALENELSKLGAKVIIEGDDITIEPSDERLLVNTACGREEKGYKKPISGDNQVVIETYDDHRMAMSFAMAGLMQAGIVIDDPACVYKTYPTYFEELERLSAAQRQ